eukprot:2274147-Heterocapsa_arctica.AAC.2
MPPASVCICTQVVGSGACQAVPGTSSWQMSCTAVAVSRLTAFPKPLLAPRLTTEGPPRSGLYRPAVWGYVSPPLTKRALGQRPVGSFSVFRMGASPPSLRAATAESWTFTAPMFRLQAGLSAPPSPLTWGGWWQNVVAATNCAPAVASPLGRRPAELAKDKL